MSCIKQNCMRNMHYSSHVLMQQECQYETQYGNCVVPMMSYAAHCSVGGRCVRAVSGRVWQWGSVSQPTLPPPHCRPWCLSTAPTLSNPVIVPWIQLNKGHLPQEPMHHANRIVTFSRNPRLGLVGEHLPSPTMHHPTLLLQTPPRQPD